MSAPNASLKVDTNSAPTADGALSLGRLKLPRNKKPAWPGPAKQSTFVFLFYGDEVYAVRNRAGELSAPGGKRDPGDRSIWNAARREFAEETGARMPKGPYEYFEWGSARHSIRAYHRKLDDAGRADLPVGPTNDPDDEEVETLWAPWRGAAARAGFRPHIAQAFEVFKAMGAGGEKWPDRLF